MIDYVLLIIAGMGVGWIFGRYDLIRSRLPRPPYMAPFSTQPPTNLCAAPGCGLPAEDPVHDPTGDVRERGRG